MALEAWIRILPFLVTTGLSTALAIHVFRRQNRVGPNTGAVLLLALAEWTLGNALEMGTTTITSKLFWLKMQYIGLSVMPVAWLLYVLRFAGPASYITRRNVVLLSALPFLVVALAFTNEAHGLVWDQVGPNTVSPFASLELVSGPVYWVFVAYGYLLTLVGFVLLVRVLLRANRVYRWQASALLASASLPVLASLFKIVGFDLFPSYDTASLALIVVAIVTGWGMFRLRLGDIVPVARKAVIESMSDGVIVLDAQNLILSLNAVAQSLTGSAASETVGRPIEQVWPGWAGSAVGSQSGREVVLSTQGGTDRVYDIHSSPLADWRGHVVGRVVVLHDLTDHKQAEEALRKAEREKAVVLDSISESVTYVDRDLRVIWVNRAAAKTAPAGTAPLAEQTCYQVCQQRDTPCDECPVQQAIETGEPQKTKVVTSDQTVLSLRAYPVCGDSGEIVGAVKVAQDITERENLERQFLKAQKMEAVGRLAGGVAHDFNNLLTAITGYAHLLMTDQDVTESMRADLGEIERAADRAATLTRQLLAFARRQMLQPEILDLNMLVQDLARMICRLVGEDVEFTTILDPELAHVRADPGQIEQVIMNLVVNARDAMPQGGQLIIQTANVQLDWQYAQQHVDVQPGPYVMLAISDTGVGMQEDILSHLFEPFFTTKDQGKGTGLGLPTVHGIVRQHDGYIWPYSEPGNGTTFKIYLPQVNQDGDLAENEANTVSADALHGSETILLAEDENAVRALTRTVLQKRGYTVLAACDGGEALTMGEQHEGPIHLLVTDIVMPGMSGRELAERLGSSHPETRVLFTSGYTEEAIDRHGAFDSDAVFLYKPYAPEALARTVREVLGKDRPARQRAI